MTVADTVQLSVQGTVNGQLHVHTLHFAYISAGASDQGLIDDWQANARTNYRALFRSDSTPVEVLTARQVCGTVPLRAAAQEAEAAANQAGTRGVSGDQSPPFLAAVISWRTGTAGRRYRGRNFIGCITEDQIAGSVIGGTLLGLLDTYAAGLLTRYGPAGTSTDYQLCVWSKTLHSLGNSCGLSTTPIRSYLIPSLVATMRSRKVGHGR